MSFAGINVNQSLQSHRQLSKRQPSSKKMRDVSVSPRSYREKNEVNVLKREPSSREMYSDSN